MIRTSACPGRVARENATPQWRDWQRARMSIVAQRSKLEREHVSAGEAPSPIQTGFRGAPWGLCERGHCQAPISRPLHFHPVFCFELRSLFLRPGLDLCGAKKMRRPSSALRLIASSKFAPKWRWARCWSTDAGMDARKTGAHRHNNGNRHGCQNVLNPASRKSALLSLALSLPTAFVWRALRLARNMQPGFNQKSS
jgi:hypothetical protein